MTREEKVSVKDILLEMAAIKGIASEIIKLAPIISQTEKDIIRLQEADKQFLDRMTALETSQQGMVDDAKADRRTDQKILVAIGVIAIGAQILIPILSK